MRASRSFSFPVFTMMWAWHHCYFPVFQVRDKDWVDVLGTVHSLFVLFLLRSLSDRLSHGFPEAFWVSTLFFFITCSHGRLWNYLTESLVCVCVCVWWWWYMCVHYVCVCVQHACVYTMYVCVHHVCVCSCRDKRSTLGVIPQVPVTMLFETRCLNAPKLAHLVRSARQWDRGIFLFPSQHPGIKVHAAWCGFLSSCWKSKSKDLSLCGKHFPHWAISTSLWACFHDSIFILIDLFPSYLERNLKFDRL